MIDYFYIIENVKKKFKKVLPLFLFIRVRRSVIETRRRFRCTRISFLQQEYILRIKLGQGFFFFKLDNVLQYVCYRRFDRFSGSAIMIIIQIFVSSFNRQLFFIINVYVFEMSNVMFKRVFRVKALIIIGFVRAKRVLFYNIRFRRVVYNNIYRAVAISRHTTQIMFASIFL